MSFHGFSSFLRRDPKYPKGFSLNVVSSGSRLSEGFSLKRENPAHVKNSNLILSLKRGILAQARDSRSRENLTYQSWKSCLSERFSPERERITWEGEILGYTGGFSPERELSRLGENWQFGAVDTVNMNDEKRECHKESHMHAIGYIGNEYFRRVHEVVSTPPSVSVMGDDVVSQCTVGVNGKTFTIVLICTMMSQLDLILEMD
ncbi:hypothetical protein Lal_00025925 [Lupinus albus]|nr:hypothetical protein Lal_00025925 [Lupinus albus]